MTARTRAALLALTAGLPAACNEPPAPPPAEKVLADLAGAWDVVYAEVGGLDRPPAQIAGLQYTFAGDQLASRLPGAAPTDVGQVTIDPGARPYPAITIRTARGPDPVVRGIYALDGDDLTMCWALLGAERPTAFASDVRTKTMLIVLKRAK